MSEKPKCTHFVPGLTLKCTWFGLDLEFLTDILYIIDKIM